MLVFDAIHSPAPRLFSTIVKMILRNCASALTALLVCVTPLTAEIIQESGSLREFIGGQSATTAYDNYVSHVAEGIASSGYNDYGPDWLDVQTDGFGNYRIIPELGNTLPYWRHIFEALLAGDLDQVDQLLLDSVQTFHYELVEFQDTEYNRVFYLIREQLDYSFNDINQPAVSADDVTGSFANGWGLFILNPEALRQQLVIEIPHPCDDFISPYFGTEMFLQADAFAMLISGAGREVRWTGYPPYSNNKSLSDPSRNANTVFQVFHEVLCDSLMQLGPHAPLVLHTHSFDDNTAHAGFQSIVLSGGWDAWDANKPIRDLSDEHLDLINFTAEYPVAAGQFGDHPALRVDDYYRVHYDGTLHYYADGYDFGIPHTYTLLGPNTGVQMNYLRQFFDNGEVYEPWVQIELFEKPMLFQDLNMPLTELYAGEYPTSYHNFRILLEYYQPFIDALNAYLVNWETVADVTPPDQIMHLRSTFDGLSYVNLEWEPVFDTNHRSYRIFYDTDSITPGSPFLDASQAIQLANPQTGAVILDNLNPEESYVFQIQALDYFNHAGPLSVPTTDSLPGHSPARILENFNSGEIELTSFAGEDADPDDWSLETDRTFMHSAYSLKLWGNTWKQEAIAPYALQAGAVFQLACYVEQRGEIQGVAFQDSLHTLFYALDGSQQLDIDDWVTVYQGYFPANTWNLNLLPVGDDWLARFDYLPTLTHIIYINDRDTDPTAKVYFDELFDISNSLLFAPEVSISYTQGSIYRSSVGTRSVDVSFQAQIVDADSPVHSYTWNFGDGEISHAPAPMPRMRAVSRSMYGRIWEST